MSEKSRPKDTPFIEKLISGINDEPSKNPVRDESKDNEIKMQRAKDIFCKFIEVDFYTAEEVTNGTVNPVKTACIVAEQIFNRFNKL